VIGVRGDAEWLVAMLLRISNMAEGEAIAMVSRSFGFAPGIVPEGERATVLTLCGSCALAAKLPVTPVLATDDIPFFEYDSGLS
jgi:hypothetical protein